MSKSENEIDKYSKMWNVRMGLDEFIEVVCPKCNGCATPYFIASLVLQWDLCNIELLASKLPFPKRVDQLSIGHGYKICSFPSESDIHPDFYSQSDCSVDGHSLEIVSLCMDCHARSTWSKQLSPKDLYWHVQTRFGVLWAENRKRLVRMRSIIESDSRPSGPLTNQLPAAMMKGSNRSEMVKLIDRVLLNGPKQ